MWKVETLNAVVTAELNALPDDMLAKFRCIGELIQTHGIERVREPHVKHIEGRLWEIRLTGRDGISEGALRHGEWAAGRYLAGFCKKDAEDASAGDRVSSY